MATIEREFLELMHQEITYERMTGRNAIGGDPSFGPPQTARARVVHHQRLVVASDGQEKMSRTTAWIFGTPGLTADDRVTLPDGSQPFIINIERFPDEKGMHHEKIAFA
jgi:hypothetical protein